MRKSTLYIVLAIGWFVVSTILLLLPASGLPEAPTFLHTIHFDKWVHAGIFGGIVFLFSHAQKILSPFLLFLLASAYGIAIEYIQKNYISNRSFDIWDIVADVVGALLGWIIFSRFSAKR